MNKTITTLTDLIHMHTAGTKQIKHRLQNYGEAFDMVGSVQITAVAFEL